MSNRTKGSYFENIVKKYLENKGYIILEQNFNCPNFGEIDIVCKKENSIIFVEVKGRTTNKYGGGELAITKSKIRNLVKASMIWLNKNNYTKDWQIDVVAIDNQYRKKVIRLRHYQNCITQNDY